MHRIIETVSPISTLLRSTVNFIGKFLIAYFDSRNMNSTRNEGIDFCSNLHYKILTM